MLPHLPHAKQEFGLSPFVAPMGAGNPPSPEERGYQAALRAAAAFAALTGAECCVICSLRKANFRLFRLCCPDGCGE